jgi:hypothetical protein
MQKACHSLSQAAKRIPAQVRISKEAEVERRDKHHECTRGCMNQAMLMITAIPTRRSAPLQLVHNTLRHL